MTKSKKTLNLIRSLSAARYPKIKPIVAEMIETINACRKRINLF